jgi:aminopeptidase N
MDTWTLQTGYPVVTIERDYEKECAKASQKRFIFNANSNLAQASRWWVPLTFCKPGKKSFTKTDEPIWLPANKESIVVENLPAANEPVIFNVQETGEHSNNIFCQFAS